MMGRRSGSLVKIGVGVAAMQLVLNLLLVAASAAAQSEKEAYLEHLQSKFLSNFFPPMDDSAHSDGTVDCHLLGNGTIDHVVVVQHLLNGGKASRGGDSALRLALTNSVPVERAPKSFKLPIKLKVKFVVKDKRDGGYNCVVTELPD